MVLPGGATVPEPQQPAEPLVLRPWRLRFAAAFFAVALTGATLIGWFTLPPRFRSEFTFGQILTLVALLALLVGVMVALAASRVRADQAGLSIRNGLRTYSVPWSRVHKFLLRDGDPWAMVLIKPVDAEFKVDLDAEKHALMGIQHHDGFRARMAVEELRRRHTLSRLNT